MIPYLTFSMIPASKTQNAFASPIQPSDQKCLFSIEGAYHTLAS